MRHFISPHSFFSWRIDAEGDSLWDTWMPCLHTPTHTPLWIFLSPPPSLSPSFSLPHFLWPGSRYAVQRAGNIFLSFNNKVGVTWMAIPVQLLKSSAYLRLPPTVTRNKHHPLLSPPLQQSQFSRPAAPYLPSTLSSHLPAVLPGCLTTSRGLSPLLSSTPLSALSLS